MARIVITYDPKGQITSQGLPYFMKSAQIDIADDVNSVDVAAISEKLTTLLLENIDL